MIKTEVMALDLSKADIWQVQKNIQQIQDQLGRSQQKYTIKDETIVNLDKDLKKDECNVSDLFKEEK